ncbi:tyrosine-type recombinase/integrase [Virgibacillus sp. C22-A2]|uniref:Tyrosine-type recombinase/integrase n=1 Tax=Virgibacillus tibetensis TaxID=3042313 RepID=A0ABU6KB29_9BACI|nr:tyrosine-type recombinase/integrase [Virgibacillus sp. C22-A2]
MKNPNGYGSVYKLSGKRRKPFGVRKTAGWGINEKTGKAKQLYENVGYYASRQEAMIALAEYNKNPYDLDAKKITFAEVFEKWSDENYKKMSESNIRGYNAAFKNTSGLHDIRFIDIKKIHMQEIVDNCNKSYATKHRIKVLFNQLYNFALENDITEKDYSKFVDVGRSQNKGTRQPFTMKEINTLWSNLNTLESADLALIMIYTGLRPGELLTIENKNIHLNDRYIIGGIKTDAGKDRIIPLNKKIVPLIEKRMDEKNKFLVVNKRNNKMAYNTFNDDRWASLIKKVKMTHKPHDCRHTFATMMDNAGANKVSIKKIMGHASSDITDKVYTHKNIEELLKAVDLI